LNIKKSFQTSSKALTFPLVHPKKIQAVPKTVADQFFYAGHKSRFLLIVNRVFP